MFVKVFMLELFSNVFFNNVYLAVFFVSMIPTVESKVAIPFAMARPIWGESALSAFMAGLIAFLGSLLPTVLMILFGKLLKKKVHIMVVEKWVEKFRAKNKNKLDKIKDKKSDFKKCFLLASFVAVPLPLTGVYTGGLIAGLCDLSFWKGFASVVIGEVFSCLIVCIFCALFENASLYIFLFALSMCFLYVAVALVVSLIKKKKESNIIRLN